MAKRTGKSASPEELDELNDLLRDQPGYAYLYEILHALKGNEDHLELMTPKDELVDHGWKDLSGKMSQGDLRKGILRSFPTVFRWVAAASFLVVLAGAVIFYHEKAAGRPGVPAKTVDHSIRIASAGYGTTARLLLSDGTHVRLNAGSKLMYPAVFYGSSREVTLEGEAFFEVARDQQAPFSVHAGKITVGVLGTSFNVKAYHEDGNIETTLISGKVQVILDDEPEKPILLSPHEKLTIVNVPAETAAAGPGRRAAAPARSFNALRYQVQSLPRDSGENFMETAWLSNRLVIDNESFETVAHMLERKYGVSIRFTDEHLLREHVSGVFDKEGIDQVLDILQMTTGFSYRIEGKTIYLWKR